MNLTHSYSSCKMFENCPRQYHEVRILRKFKSSETDATRYGTEVHKALELNVLDNTPVPEQFKQFEPYAESVKRMSGTVLCEQKMGLRRDFSPCDFFAPDVWFRGVPDVLAINDTGTARVLDWKTGKSSRYADTSQLELMAGMVFAHYPQVQKVKGALIFLVARDIVKADYTRAQFAEIMSKWAGKAAAIEGATVWNPRKGPLCRFCPVSSDACEFKE
jgi:CRISPR/Cas system-associated exonuclease Cas4 (RecB family)